MSFLSFLSSHRLHSSHRPWIDPLPVQLDLFVHELPHDRAAGEHSPEVRVADADPAAAFSACAPDEPLRAKPV